MERPEPKIRRRNLNWISRDLYQIEFALKGAHSSIHLNWEELGFDGEELDELEASDAKLSAIPLYDAVNTKGAILKRGRNRIYSLMLPGEEGYRVCTVDKLPKIWDSFKDLQRQGDRLRLELVDDYFEGKEDFVYRVCGILALKAFDLKRKFGLTNRDIMDRARSLAERFPSIEEIEESYMQVRVGRYEVLPSLEAQLKKNRELSLAKAEAAQAELLEQRLKDEQKVQEAQTASQIRQIREAESAARRFQRQKEEDTIRLRDEILASVRQSGLEIANDLLRQLEEWDTSQPISKGIKRKLSRIANTLENYLGADLDGTIEEVFGSLRATQRVANSNLEKEQLDQVIERIKAKVTSQITQIKLTDSEEEGHALASLDGFVFLRHDEEHDDEDQENTNTDEEI